jgi:hypothetical protein
LGFWVELRVVSGFVGKALQGDWWFLSDSCYGILKLDEKNHGHLTIKERQSKLNT